MINIPIHRQLFHNGFNRLGIAYTGQFISYRFILRSNVRVSRKLQQLEFDQEKTITERMQVEIDGVDDAVNLLLHQGKKLNNDQSSEIQSDACVLHKRGYDDDLFKIEKQKSKFTHGQIRDFEAHLNDTEEEAYAQAIIRQVEQSAATATATKARAKTTKKRSTKLTNTKTKKNVVKASTISSPSPLPSPQTASEDEFLFNKNESLRNIYNNWNLTHSENLPIVSPLLSNDTPFNFYTKHNADPSIIKAARLAATKLLVNNWCQMREYYKVYAGSPRSPPTKAMEQGTLHHAILEEETHPLIDIMDMLKFVSEKAYSLKRELKAKAGLLNEREENRSQRNSLIIDLDVGKAVKAIDEMLTISEEEKLANDWSHKVITRLFALLTNSQAREIPIHGYIDLNKLKFIESKDGVETLDNSVLVSAIVDLFKFGNHKDPTDLTFVTEMQNMMDFEFGKDQAGLKPVIDLTKFIPETQKILTEYNRDGNLSLIISDVKTRSEDSLPPQKSVLNGARNQTFLYRKLFNGLTKNPQFTYRGLLENGVKRKLDIDKPLSPIMVLQMLRLNPHLFYNDFVKLSNGEPIGFEPFDEDVKLNKLNKSISVLKIERYTMDKSVPPHHDDFRFDLLFQNADEFSFTSPSNKLYLGELEQMESQSNQPFPYSHYMEPLLKTWQTPPTLRYLAARSAQLFHLFNNFTNDATTVEYHNAKTHEIFEICQYQYKEQEIQLELNLAFGFWFGKMLPKFADSKTKCRFCEFRLKCIVGRGEADDLIYKRKMVGPKLREFIGKIV